MRGLNNKEHQIKSFKQKTEKESPGPFPASPPIPTHVVYVKGKKEEQ